MPSKQMLHPTAIDDLLALAFETRSVASWVRERHDPFLEPEEYARALFSCLARPSRPPSDGPRARVPD